MKRSIRHVLVATCIASVPTAVLARPTADPGECIVTVIRAPAEVRAEIDKWVAAEHACQTTLEVRVLVTEGGYYLWGRDGFGREHERIVPDAQTAAVLVASWVADDSYVVAIPIDPFGDGRPGPDGARGAGLAGARGVGLAGGPSTVDPFVAHGVAAGVERHAPRFAFGLAALRGPAVYGVRADLDVRIRSEWSVVLGLTVSRQSDLLDNVFYDGAGDINASVSAARHWTRGPWQLRVQGGAGITRSSDYDFDTQLGLFPTLEAAAQLSYGRGDWQLFGGPMITVFARNAGIWGKNEFVEMEASSEVRSQLVMGLRRRW